MLHNSRILVSDAVYDNPPAYLFDAADWPTDAGSATAGRGNTFFVGAAAGDFVLRHYHRGGLVAKLSADRYFALGAGRSRSFREWRLLKHLFTNGLPVPEPVAARYVRSGITYRADLLTRRIPNAQTLAELLAYTALTPAAWRALGATLRAFHDKGVWHADLNAHNIMRDREDAWYLIDFDRGRIRAGVGWKPSNLARLQRSLLKITGNAGAANFDDAAWGELMAGYETSSARSSA